MKGALAQPTPHSMGSHALNTADGVNDVTLVTLTVVVKSLYPGLEAAGL